MIAVDESRQLRDREDEDEVEELERRDADAALRIGGHAPIIAARPVTGLRYACNLRRMLTT